MKPYGVPRELDVEAPDKLDITHYGLAPSRHGEKRKPSVKKYARRIWKKLARRLGKKQILEEMNND